MILSLDEAKVFNPKVTQEWLDGIESTIRNVSGNNFQNHNVRLRNISFDGASIRSNETTVGFMAGQTIQVSNSVHNDGLFVIGDASEKSLIVENHTFLNINVTGAFATLVSYPPDILSGVIELLRYDARMTDKIGIKSEKISRWSVTYSDMESRYPSTLLEFISNRKKLRW